MPDLSPEEHRDIIEAAKARDERIALIGQAIDIEAEQRDSPTWRYLDHRLATERTEILDALARVDPANVGLVARLQARAMAATLIPNWLDELFMAAHTAEEQINVEDGHASADS
jgi:hypothetical protein